MFSDDKQFAHFVSQETIFIFQTFSVFVWSMHCIVCTVCSVGMSSSQFFHNFFTHKVNIPLTFHKVSSTQEFCSLWPRIRPSSLCFLSQKCSQTDTAQTIFQIPSLYNYTTFQKKKCDLRLIMQIPNIQCKFL